MKASGQRSSTLRQDAIPGSGVRSLELGCPGTVFAPPNCCKGCHGTRHVLFC
jgi:hypothetical protein